MSEFDRGLLSGALIVIGVYVLWLALVLLMRAP